MKIKTRTLNPEGCGTRRKAARVSLRSVLVS
jgi:hypothetical protein